ncbi:MAG: hypothetical protein COA90_06940 [Gammaproteobacteria bacterium]|nr:MAG: hypothetical protein COA90_06940 [Gammaproteobacteria bacterium]
MEVHHIKQEALGGSNTYDNAISLCFDCHCDAGHYNPKHPRGTKFSPRELKKAKENWIQLVADNNIKQPSEPDSFLCQYFVCESYENLVEISNGDLSKFPVDYPLLVNNEILTSLKKIIKNHPERYRHASAWGKGYKGKDEYLSEHPDATVTNESEDKFSYFEITRTPTKEELNEISSKDGVLKLMLEENLPIEDVSAIVGCYEDACGGIELQEEYIFRRLWCAFAVITNISDQPMALDSLDVCQNKKNGFSELVTSNHDSKSINLPKVPIKPGATVIVPLAVLLPPLYSIAREEWSSKSTGDGSEQVQIVTHGSVMSRNVNDTYTYGDSIFPNAMYFKKDGNINTQEFHSFDLTNMYCIDRHWQCGSCPHLFFMRGEIAYKRELLAHCESTIGEDSFDIPKGVNSIIIAEIEDETTEIQSIFINDRLYLSNLTLRKSEFIEITVPNNAVVRVVGQYIPDGDSNKSIPQGVKRNDIVSQFMYSYSKWSENGDGTSVSACFHP